MSIFDNAYLAGANFALIKLGAVAGPIAHALREDREEFDFSQDKSEDLWREMDQEPDVTGEESSLGMPSAGGINKNSSDNSVFHSSAAIRKKYPLHKRSQNTAPYGDLLGKQAADDYAASSGDDYGSFDHNAPKPQREQILSSAIEEAFKANEDYDQSYGMGEPAMTQPHGSKYAAGSKLHKASLVATPIALAGAYVAPEFISSSKTPKTPKTAMQNLLAFKYAAGMNPLAGGSSPIATSIKPLTSQGLTPIKPPSIPKPKAPGANIMANVHQNSNALLSSNSIMSGGTRAIGSPLPSGAQAAGGSLT